MNYYMVTAKLGHVGKNYFYKGTMFLYAKDAKEAAKVARDMPRVKHDRKDAILEVMKIPSFIYDAGMELNNNLHYFNCESVQEQRMYMDEIKDNIFEETDENDIYYKERKKHNLRKNYNDDPDWEYFKNMRGVDIA